MKHSRRFLGLSLLLVLVAALLVAVACGPAATPTPTPAPTPTPTPTKPPPTPTPTVATVATATPTPTRAAPAPTATPTPAAVAAPKGTLTAVTGGTGVGTPSGWPTDCLWCASLVMVGAQEGLLKIDKAADGSWIAGPWLAETWETSKDFKYTDFKLRNGVTFNKGFGEMTAYDVVYTYNAADPAVTKEARHDTLPNASIASVQAVDKYTFRINWKAYSGATILELTDFNEGVGIFPKKAQDEKGSEWMRTNFIGTGPFEMTEWTAQKGMYLKARPEHWRKVPYVDQYVLLEIPESATRRAMLESGQAAIGDPDIKDWQALMDRGFKKSPEGPIDMWQIIYGGQYWEEKHYITGEALNRKLDTTKAWIGNPFGPGCNYADFKITQPAGTVCPSMENARKVRLALAMDVDRKGINDSILKGLGRVSYMPVPLDDPLWKSYGDKWKIPYDPAQAKKLMTEAGYAGGFTLQWWVGPSGVGVEIGEAVGAAWLADLNVKVEFDRRAYSAMRPAMVERTANFFQLRNLGNTSSLMTGDLGGWIYSSHVPAGYNHAMEVPKASQVYYDKLKAVDEKEMIRLTMEFVDYLYYWMLAPTIVQTPGNALYNSRVVADWVMRPLAVTRLSGIRNVEYIKLAQ